MRKSLTLFLCLLLLLGLCLWAHWGNTALMLTQHTVPSAQLPESFDGFQIAHVSDLHNTELDRGNQQLLRALTRAEPDMIAITGDLVDSWHDDFEVARSFIREAVNIAPVYYVPGNHEVIPEYEALKEFLLAAGVFVLEDESMLFHKGQEAITISGLRDPDFGYPLPDLAEETYQILLSHRPELIDYYTRQGFELVLSGHAHGGQFRLPFIGGLVAPNQGFFPKYDAGRFDEDNTTMIVSRGVGNSIIPLRINNPPELVVVELKRQ